MLLEPYSFFRFEVHCSPLQITLKPIKSSQLIHKQRQCRAGSEYIHFLNQFGESRAVQEESTATHAAENVRWTNLYRDWFSLCRCTGGPALSSRRATQNISAENWYLRMIGIRVCFRNICTQRDRKIVMPSAIATTFVKDAPFPAQRRHAWLHVVSRNFCPQAHESCTAG